MTCSKSRWPNLLIGSGCLTRHNKIRRSLDAHPAQSDSTNSTRCRSTITAPDDGRGCRHARPQKRRPTRKALLNQSGQPLGHFSAAPPVIMNAGRGRKAWRTINRSRSTKGGKEPFSSPGLDQLQHLRSNSAGSTFTVESRQDFLSGEFDVSIIGRLFGFSLQ